jgi:hypothetical protein
MKHPRVANRVEDKDKSPKIVGYIYEKIVAMQHKNLKWMKRHENAQRHRQLLVTN